MNFLSKFLGSTNVYPVSFISSELTYMWLTLKCKLVAEIALSLQSLCD